MSAGNTFDLDVPTQQGIKPLEASALIDKKARGPLLMAGALMDEEQNDGYRDFQTKQMSEPANILFWQAENSPIIAPRGAYGGWTNCMPAYHQGTNEWQPVEEQAQFKADVDFKKLSMNAVINYGIEFPKATLAFVSATTKHGAHEPIAIVGGGPLVAHWRGTQPPLYSRHLYDIDANGRLDPERHAGLHSLAKVQKWDVGVGSAVPGPPKFSIALNGGYGADGVGGMLRVSFGQGNDDAVYSFLMSGPFIPSFPQKHLIGVTSDGNMDAGAISTNAYFRGSAMPFTAPIRFEEEPYPTVLNGEIPYEVHKYYDASMDHPFFHGTRLGMWRDFVKLPIGETPPCEPTKNYSAIDANGNPARTFMPSSVFLIQSKPLISTSIYFQQRVNLQKGRRPFP